MVAKGVHAQDLTPSEQLRSRREEERFLKVRPARAASGAPSTQEPSPRQHALGSSDGEMVGQNSSGERTSFAAARAKGAHQVRIITARRNRSRTAGAD